jgi:ComF family protein
MPQLDTLKELLAWIYPGYCQLCGLRTLDGCGLCPGCLESLPRTAAACPRCAAPVGENVSLCGRCQQEPPAFQAAVAPFAYRPPLDRLIVGLKFHGRLHVSRSLGLLLARELAGCAELPEVIMPIPLHRSRLRERGYNQALEIARATGKALALPVDGSSLVRVRATAPQTELPRALRRRNVRGAFALAKPVGRRRVALLDDVMTSGATANEAALTLLRAGVERVSVWAVARA